MDRLNRTKLLFGDEAIKKLSSAIIMVVGCGAVGSFAIEALARSGVGTLILIDSDCIEESNINRQLFALDSTINKEKVDVAQQRIKDINPRITVIAKKLFFDQNTNLEIQPDFVIDAIDTVPSKIALYQWCQNHKIPFISSMGAARKTDPTKIKIDKLSKTSVCPLASKIRKLVKTSNLQDFDTVFSTEAVTDSPQGKNFGSLITVTGTFGLFMANYAIQFVLNHPTQLRQ